MAQKALTGLDPLKDLLGEVLARLEALENRVGTHPPTPGGPKSPHPVKASIGHGTSFGCYRID